jgi:hypothetical protein
MVAKKKKKAPAKPPLRHVTTMRLRTAVREKLDAEAEARNLSRTELFHQIIDAWFETNTR